MWYRIGATPFVTIAKLSQLEGKALEAFGPMQPRRKKRCDAFMPSKCDSHCVRYQKPDSNRECRKGRASGINTRTAYQNVLSLCR